MMSEAADRAPLFLYRPFIEFGLLSLLEPCISFQKVHAAPLHETSQIGLSNFCQFVFNDQWPSELREIPKCVVVPYFSALWSPWMPLPQKKDYNAKDSMKHWSFFFLFA